jgi:hypothetical protein
VLAGTQALSLALLWPHASPPHAGLTGPVAVVPAPAAALEPRTSEPPATPGLWTARHKRPDLVEAEDRPDSDVTFIESGPPLRMFASPASSLLN